MKENLKRVKIIQLPTLLKINRNGLQPFKLDNYFIPQTGAFARKLKVLKLKLIIYILFL